MQFLSAFKQITILKEMDKRLFEIHTDTWNPVKCLRRKGQYALPFMSIYDCKKFMELIYSGLGA